MSIGSYLTFSHSSSNEVEQAELETHPSFLPKKAALLDKKYLFCHRKASWNLRPLFPSSVSLCVQTKPDIEQYIVFCNSSLSRKFLDMGICGGNLFLYQTSFSYCFSDVNMDVTSVRINIFEFRVRSNPKMFTRFFLHANHMKKLNNSFALLLLCRQLFMYSYYPFLVYQLFVRAMNFSKT